MDKDRFRAGREKRISQPVSQSAMACHVVGFKRDLPFDFLVSGASHTEGRYRR